MTDHKCPNDCDKPLLNSFNMIAFKAPTRQYNAVKQIAAGRNMHIRELMIEIVDEYLANFD
jgi:hypothetical protein